MTSANASSSVRLGGRPSVSRKTAARPWRSSTPADDLLPGQTFRFGQCVAACIAGLAVCRPVAALTRAVALVLVVPAPSPGVVDALKG